MIADEELAQAVAVPAHWRPDGEHAAIYQRPGATGYVPGPSDRAAGPG